MKNYFVYFLNLPNEISTPKQTREFSEFLRGFFFLFCMEEENDKRLYGRKSSKFFTDGNVQEEHMKNEGMGL